MPVFGTRGRKGNGSRVPIYLRELERFRTEILYETLREKGYAVSRKLASIHTQQGSLEDAARDLRGILLPPRAPSHWSNKPWWLWALAIIGVIFIAALGGVVFYLMEPKIFNSLFLNIEKYFNYFYDLIIVPIINFITTV